MGIHLISPSLTKNFFENQLFCLQMIKTSLSFTEYKYRVYHHFSVRGVQWDFLNLKKKKKWLIEYAKTIENNWLSWHIVMPLRFLFGSRATVEETGGTCGAKSELEMLTECARAEWLHINL